MEKKKHYKIKLKAGVNEREWEDFLESLSLSYEKKEYFPSYYIYKIEEPNEEMKTFLSQRKEIAYFHEMYSYYLNFQTKKIEGNYPKWKGSQVEKDYPVVGVIDNGIADFSLFGDWILRTETSYCPEKQRATHGTFVAGVILFGDELAGSDWVGGEKVQVLDATIVPDFSLYQLEEDELLFRLRKVVEDHPWVKIWNLAISIRYGVDLDRISEFGLLLDYLQEKNQILICKSCGNGNFTLRKEERDHILHGSDSARALVVAACNSKRELSSFSLSGRGHQILEKPDVAMYGGDVFWNEEGKRKIEGVLSFSEEGELVSSFGTSFATARITSLLGNVLFWKKDASPLFLKALLVQSASGGERHYLGYGCPKNSQGLREEFENSFYREGSLTEESLCYIVPKTGNRLLVSLSSDIVVDYEQEQDYILSDLYLEIYLGEEAVHSRNIYGLHERYQSLKKYDISVEDSLEKEWRLVLRVRRKEGMQKGNKAKQYCLLARG